MTNSTLCDSHMISLWMFLIRWVRKVDRDVKNNFSDLEAAIVPSAGETAILEAQQMYTGRDKNNVGTHY